jgi:CRP/FNR family cyclic AMP-dependent transcriptional regulator
VFPNVFDPQELSSEQANRRAGRRSSMTDVHVHFASVPLFSGCSKKELRLLAKTAVVEPRAAGAALVTEGQPGTSAFVVLQGTCRVVRKGRKIGTIGVGAVVGELALLTRAPRNATVVAESPLEVAVLSRRDFLALLESSPSITLKLLQTLATRLHEVDTGASP